MMYGFLKDSDYYFMLTLEIGVEGMWVAFSN